MKDNEKRNADASISWRTEMIGEIKSLAEKLPTGWIIDADTMLADLLQHIEPETGIAQELFKIWTDSSDKASIESMFYLLTDMTFDDFLSRVRECLVAQNRGERGIA